jgi:uncharacterized membrane protein YjfL (UPF0719 family)
MFESFSNSLYVALGAVADALVLLAVIFIGRAYYRITTKVKLEDEIVVRDNPAMGVALAGFLIGLAIAASGGLLVAGTPLEKALMIGGVGLVSMILMRISLVINDKFILSKFSNIEEIVRDKNLGVGFVEAGGCIATGLMINGVMSGKADNIQDKLLYGAIYWTIGQIALIIGAFIFRPHAGFDFDFELEENNNAAAGLSFAGFIIGIGMIVRASLNGVSTALVPEVATIAVFAFIGFVLLAFGKIAMDKVVLPTAKMNLEINRDKNMGAGALSAAGYVCIAVLFAASISPATTSAIFADAIDDPSSTVVPAKVETATPLAKPEKITPVAPAGNN